ncbi:MAG: transposase [candidate division Zixibacteria bacterium]|nr:transposase [candidate division Zixibacteria bacterium]
MKSLRRVYIPGAIYFVTVITFNRRPILLRDPDLFLSSWKLVRPSAWVTLPDHFHIVVTPPAGNISDLMHRFKITYARRFRDKYGPGRVWQNRFWDRVMRDQKELNHHLDYIHINPVHHGLITGPFEYKHSSASQHLAAGFYQSDWGGSDIIDIEGDFGE